MRYVTLFVNDIEVFKHRRGFITRCVAAGIFLSHSIRRNVVFRIYIRRRNLLISFKTTSLRNVRSDEQSLGGILDKIYKSISLGKKRRKIHSGVVLSVKTFSEVLKRMTDSLALYEHVDGKDIRMVDLSKARHIMYVISENLFYPEGELEYFKSHKFIPVNVSKSRICVDSRIVLFNNELDRRGL
ncbi:MAG: hypothetical protein DRJ38_02045 [Thermoprotei archaeon]|nr:MAG: hypothetical protein DRJ38_02045 [Thermoprotei archaeon]